MDAEHAARLESLCVEALSKDARERAAFLDEACRGDAELRREVDLSDERPRVFCCKR